MSTITTPNQRDAYGRFAKGNSLGQGRPRKEIERDYLAAIRDACSSEDVKEIFTALVNKAKEGDIKAARLVLDSFLGSREPFDLTQMAIDEALGCDPVEESIRMKGDSVPNQYKGENRFPVDEEKNNGSGDISRQKNSPRQGER